MNLQEYMTPDELTLLDNFLEENTPMKRVSTRGFRSDLSEHIMRSRFRNEGTVISHHGKSMCVMVPIEVAQAIQTAKERASKSMN